MALRHERFTLHDVTFAGVSLPGATMDCWEDTRGHPQWLARVMTRSCALEAEGELSGRTAGGRPLSGHALVADQQVGDRRQTLIVFHGSGTLHGF